MEGKEAGALGIRAEDLDDAAFNFIFLNEEVENHVIPKEKLLKLQKEFNYWYPLDLRCSGKDLIKNHLTMSLFNH